MENYGIMDNNEDLCKQEKNEEIKTDKSISFENFLKKKSISQETSNKNSLSPVRTNEISDKIFEKTPLAKKIDNNGNYSNSMKKIKKLIDSSFQKTEISEMQEDRPLCNELNNKFLR